MPKTKSASAAKTKSSKSTSSKSTKAKAKSPKASATKAKSPKAKGTAKTRKAASLANSSSNNDNESLELLNETGRRRKNVTPAVERRKRRRQIDPTTCERDYSEQEIEFMQAMDDYKRQSGRMFPTCSEILEVLIKLGYRQIAESSDLMFDPEEESKKVVVEESLDTEFEGEDDED